MHFTALLCLTHLSPSVSVMISSPLSCSSLFMRLMAGVYWHFLGVSQAHSPAGHVLISWLRARSLCPRERELIVKWVLLGEISDLLFCLETFWAESIFKIKLASGAGLCGTDNLNPWANHWFIFRHTARVLLLRWSAGRNTPGAFRSCCYSFVTKLIRHHMNFYVVWRKSELVIFRDASKPPLQRWKHLVVV